MAANGTGPLVFIDDVTADRYIRVDSEVYRDKLSGHIQPNATKLIGQCTRHRWKMTVIIVHSNSGLFEDKEMEYSFLI